MKTNLKIGALEHVLSNISRNDEFNAKEFRKYNLLIKLVFLNNISILVSPSKCKYVSHIEYLFTKTVCLMINWNLDVFSSASQRNLLFPKLSRRQYLCNRVQTRISKQTIHFHEKMYILNTER